jgi:hypothetical protein
MCEYREEDPTKGEVTCKMGFAAKREKMK